jgi:3-methylcrotonyl-CoA carboxylase alpha subunit
MMKKILIANRGEIACRIAKTARRLGIATVAVFSDADSHALHVESTDEAIHIGPAPARESYLMGDKILAAALKTGADAIHPGYGFLSENADFAEAVIKAGLIWIGPPPAAIRAMGGKAESKSLMAAANVPLVPGYHDIDQSLTTLADAAAKIGFPVLIKASAGGGGKGMKIVENAAELADAVDSARREAAAGFGNDRLLLEKYLRQPRHIEVQIFCDQYGHGVYLFERDCSIQRRHQKVVEEAPAPGLTPALREKLGLAALAAARSVAYVGAGTVEFLVDHTGDFYFMEMNTRLQVEHPVTEAITGLDLVEWQCRVASGEPLPFQQSDLSINGHAIEVRLYAEDADRDFLPQTGIIQQAFFPTSLARFDTGIRSNDAITIYYDPMIAKIICHGPDRETARQKMAAALAATRLIGPICNLDFLRRVIGHDDFALGKVDTGFIPRLATALFPEPIAPSGLTAMAVALDWLDRQKPATPASPWDIHDGWWLNGVRQDSLLLIDEQKNRWPVTLQAAGPETMCGSEPPVRFIQKLEDIIIVEQAGHRHSFQINRQGSTIYLRDPTRAIPPQKWTIDDRLEKIDQTNDGDNQIRAPMPGKVIAVRVAVGDTVGRGTVLMVIEAMKMEHALTAPRDSVIQDITIQPGDQVTDGDILIRLGEIE